MVWRSKKIYTETDTIFVVLGNIVNLCDNQEIVDENEAKEFAKNIKAIFSITSKGDHIGMNYLLEKIARKIINKDKPGGGLPTLWNNELEKYIDFWQ